MATLSQMIGGGVPMASPGGTQGDLMERLRAAFQGMQAGDTRRMGMPKPAAEDMQGIGQATPMPLGSVQIGDQGMKDTQDVVPQAQSTLAPQGGSVMAGDMGRTLRQQPQKPMYMGGGMAKPAMQGQDSTGQSMPGQSMNMGGLQQLMSQPGFMDQIRALLGNRMNAPQAGGMTAPTQRNEYF